MHKSVVIAQPGFHHHFPGRGGAGQAGNGIVKIKQELACQLAHLFEAAVGDLALSLCGKALKFGFASLGLRVLALPAGFRRLGFGVPLAGLRARLARHRQMAFFGRPKGLPYGDGAAAGQSRYQGEANCQRQPVSAQILHDAVGKVAWPGQHGPCAEVAPDVGSEFIDRGITAVGLLTHCHRNDGIRISLQLATQVRRGLAGPGRVHFADDAFYVARAQRIQAVRLLAA